MHIPKRAVERIAANLKKYQNILTDARDRDKNENDTVLIIVEMLADLLGYRRFREITTEFKIKNKFVDIAVKMGDEIRFLVEAKAIGIQLNDKHTTKAVDYAANKGVEPATQVKAIRGNPSQDRRSQAGDIEV
ncbi:MAG: hypothetical protein HY521_15030 [Proteobacteria bacterium]|nr:hypothetical protein [Pseudomonadota bacterium]